MPVPQYRDFAPEGPFPATWTDAVEKFLTGSRNFVVRKATATTVEVPAGALGAGLSVVSAAMIQGKPRWIESTVSRAHPGGAAGVYDVWLVAAADSFAGSGVTEVDNTFSGFELRIVATGAAAPTGTLAGGQAIAHAEKVATATWNGTAITRVDKIPQPGNVLKHASEHAATGTDPILPADIGAGVRHGVRLHRAAATPFATNGIESTVPWDTQDDDTEDFWSVGVSDTITVERDGVYVVVFSAAFGPKPTVGPVRARLAHTRGVTTFQTGQTSVSSTTIDTELTVAMEREMLADDWVQALVYFENANPVKSPQLSLYRISD